MFALGADVEEKISGSGVDLLKIYTLTILSADAGNIDLFVMPVLPSLNSLHLSSTFFKSCLHFFPMHTHLQYKK